MSKTSRGNNPHDTKVSVAATIDTKRMNGEGPLLADPTLGLLADILNDIEEVRIAAENRVRILTRDEPDTDGELRGFRLPPDHPGVAVLAGIATEIKKVEAAAVKELEKAMRAHPLAHLQKREKGVGEKQLARVLGEIGDPYWNDLHDRPRTFGELKAFCGLAVVDGRGQHRKKGVVVNYNPMARVRLWAIASQVVKVGVGGKYEQIYRDRRALTEDRVHSVECPRCGPSGEPAQPGTPWSRGHQHADALRIVMVEILRDLWEAAREYHQAGDLAA